MLKEGVLQKFLTETDHTGRFIVTSQRTGRKYFVEPVGDPHREWGSIDPSSNKLMVKKAWKKYRGSIDEQDSLITEDNGFENIRLLEPGVSPLKAIEYYDDQYPDKE